MTGNQGAGITRRDAVKAAVVAVTAAPALGLAQEHSGKILRYAFNAAETGFDPAQVVDLYSRIVTAHIFDGLYTYDHLARPFKIKPNAAAAGPEVSVDFRTWTVRLKPGIYFQDDPAFGGRRRELVAQDYVYSFKRFFDPRWKSPAYATLAESKMLGLASLREQALKGDRPFDYDHEIGGLRALDRYTLQFRLEAPNPRFVQILAAGDLWGAVAREVVEAYGDQIMAHPVGTGPFHLVEWRRSSTIVLERNPAYREHYYDAEPDPGDAEALAIAAKFSGRRLPMIDRVEISIINENQPRWLAFLNGEHDFIDRLPIDFANVAAPGGELAPNLQRRGVQMYRALNPDVFFSWFNMEHPVVGGYTAEKVALRRAIGLAINIDEEIRLYWRGQAVAAQSSIMPGLVGYDPSYRTETSEYNLPRAKALLDTYGYIDRDGDGWREQPDGSPLVLEMATQTDQQARQRDELWRRYMRSVGIRIEFKPAQWPENLKNARAGKLMMWWLGTSAAAPDGLPGLDRGATIHFGGQNFARFSMKSFDEIYGRLRTLPDGTERQRLFFEAKRILAAYAPYRSHVHRINTDLAQSWLVGYRRPPFWLPWWQYVDIDVGSQRKASK